MKTIAILLFLTSFVLLGMFIMNLFRKKPKKLFFFSAIGCFVLSLILIPTTDATEEPKAKEKAKSEATTAKVDQKKKDEPTQEELNAKLMQEAVEADFVAANSEEYEKNKRIKTTGEIGVLVNKKGTVLPVFTLQTTEGNGFGVYEVKLFIPELKVEQNKIIMPDGKELIEGTKVTVYGTYDGKDESGIPLINSTVIEVIN